MDSLDDQIQRRQTTVGTRRQQTQRIEYGAYNTFTDFLARLTKTRNPPIGDLSRQNAAPRNLKIISADILCVIKTFRLRTGWTRFTHFYALCIWIL